MTRKYSYSKMLNPEDENEIDKLLSDIPNIEKSTTLKVKELDLRIVTPEELKTTQKVFCNLATPLAIKQMIEQNINPFDWPFESPTIINLFLSNKKIGMLGALKKPKELQKHILQMNGILNDDEAEIFIAQKWEKTPHPNSFLVSSNWIETLYSSKHYVDPTNFTFANKDVFSTNMKSMRKNFKMISSPEREFVLKRQNMQSITNFFSKNSQISQKQTQQQKQPKKLNTDNNKSIKKENKTDEIPLPNPNAFLSNRKENRNLNESNSSNDQKLSKVTPKKSMGKLIHLDSSSDDESLMQDVTETLKKCALSPRTDYYISQHTGQQSESAHSSQISKFEESSEDEEVELFAPDKIAVKSFNQKESDKVSPEKTPTLATPPRSISIISKTQSDVSPHAPCLLDSPCTYSRGALPLLPSPKTKLTGRSQASPIVKNMNDDDETCAKLCSIIMSTKINTAPKSPLRHKFSMDDIIQFTQQQCSQKDFETEIHYNTNDMNSRSTEKISQNSDPLLAQLLE